MKQIALILFIFFISITEFFSQTFTSLGTTNLTATHSYGGVLAHRPTHSIYVIGGWFNWAYPDQIQQYDINTNTWNSPISGPAGMRSCFGYYFNINNRLFYGGGANSGYSSNNNTWEFIPPNTFASMDPIPTMTSPYGRSYCFSFSIGNYGYVGQGEGMNGSAGSITPVNDMQRFDPSVAPSTTGQWKTVKAYPGIGQSNMVAASLGGYGYAGLGSTVGGTPASQNDFYRYDPTMDTWTLMQSFPGAAREGAILLPVCNKLILMVGSNAAQTAYFDDMWEFDPNSGPTGNWTLLGHYSQVYGPSSGRGWSASAAYGTDSLFFGMGYSSTNQEESDWNLLTFNLASVSGNATICQGTNTLLSASGVPLYIWTPSAGLSNTLTTSSSVPNGTTQTTASPIVTTTYTVTDAICGQYMPVTVAVLPLPTIDVSGNSTVCSGTNVALTASGGTSYSWNTGATTNNINVSPTVTSLYNVSIYNSSVGNGLCSESANIWVSVPAIKISSHNATICSGSSTVLSASGGDSYLWSTGSTASSVVVSPVSSTSYSLSGSYGICAVSASFTVSVNALPVIVITGNTSVCGGSSTTLTASGGIKYLWNNGTTGSIITVTPTSAISYTVIVTSSFGCSDSSSVAVKLSPVIALVNSQTICSGSKATLSASGGSFYLWNTGQTNSSITVSSSFTTNYTVMVSDGNCTNSAATKLVVNSLPTVLVCCNVTINSSENVLLSFIPPVNTNDSYSWSPTSGLSSYTSYNPTANPLKSTEYFVTITDSNGCKGIDSVWVMVNIACNDIFVPNAFSPNGDGQNDVLYIETKNINCIEYMSFNIYDRWGNKVFDTTDITVSWDGKYKNRQLDPAVFVYWLQATFTDGTSINKKGNVTLIK